MRSGQANASRGTGGDRMASSQQGESTPPPTPPMRSGSSQPPGLRTGPCLRQIHDQLEEPLVSLRGSWCRQPTRVVSGRLGKGIATGGHGSEGWVPSTARSGSHCRHKSKSMPQETACAHRPVRARGPCTGRAPPETAQRKKKAEQRDASDIPPPLLRLRRTLRSRLEMAMRSREAPCCAPRDAS